MFKDKKVVFAVLGGAVILALIAGGAALASTTIARAQETPLLRAADLPLTNVIDSVTGDGFGHRGGPFPGKGVADNTYLADALGISVDELEAAYEAASLKAIDQAVTEGLLTEEQAETLKERASGFFGRNFKFGGMPGEFGSIDFNALLASELGISVEELQAAHEEAMAAALEAEVESGNLTQEQVDLMQARQALNEYIDRDALMEDVLGMTVEEVQEAMQAAYEAKVQEAVENGIITQDQAEQILSEQAGFGHGFFPGFDRGGGGMPHGRGGFDRFPFPGGVDTMSPGSDT